MSILSPALGEKATYVRDYVTADNRGFYTWGAQYVTTVDGPVTTKRADITLNGNRIQTGRIPLMQMGKVKLLIETLREKKLTPEGGIFISYYPVITEHTKPVQLLSNLINILEARRSLIEQALSLKEPMEIYLAPGNGLALSISLSAFSSLDDSFVVIFVNLRDDCNRGEKDIIYDPETSLYRRDKF